MLRDRPGHLPCRDVDAVPGVDDGDRNSQRGESLFIVMLRDLVPDFVWHWVAAVAEPGRGLSQREGGSFGVGKVASSVFQEFSLALRLSTPGQLRPSRRIGLAGALTQTLSRLRL
jgi:hypothetical protein